MINLSSHHIGTMDTPSFQPLIYTETQHSQDSTAYPPLAQPSTPVLSLQSQHTTPYDTVLTDAVQKTFTARLRLQLQITNRLKTIKKLEEHQTAGTFPADLNFKFSCYQQYPEAMGARERTATQEREKEIILKAQTELLQVRLDALTQHHKDLVAKYGGDTAEAWKGALLEVIPDIARNEELVQRAMQMMEAEHLQRTLRNSANPKPNNSSQAAEPRVIELHDTPMEEERTDNNAPAKNPETEQLKKELAQLRDQMKQFVTTATAHMKETRAKNGSGSGTDYTGRRGNHAANSKSTLPRSSQRSGSHRPRPQNKSRSPSRSRTTSRSHSRTRHTARSESPPSRRANTPRRASTPRRDPTPAPRQNRNQQQNRRQKPPQRYDNFPESPRADRQTRGGAGHHDRRSWRGNSKN